MDISLLYVWNMLGGGMKMTDSYRTDTWILQMFDEWFDPCPFNEDWNESHGSGLEIMWKPFTFVNPPYSNPKPWVQYGIMQNKMYGFPIAYLLKHDSSTEWYRLLHEAGANFLLVNGRLKHQTGKSCAFPSVIAFLEGWD
tara:strand:+ start:306 stop:725 length:420 start_codon:yes stop_codon:yes gene_type:complete